MTLVAVAALTTASVPPFADAQVSTLRFLLAEARRRALPMPAGVFLAAKWVAAMLFAGVVSIMLALLASIVGNVMLELVEWVNFLILAVPGVVPWDGLGLLPWWPACHLEQVVQYAVDEGGVDLGSHILDLAGMAIVFCVIARRALRKLR